MDKLKIYNAVRQVPKEAQKPITGGRLNGKTDINPMWRIKTLTEQFGPCGVGWKYTVEKMWLEEGANNEITAFVNIHLFIKFDNKWSDAIPGTGGSCFVVKESKGLYTSDECYKMALTDAISVACKALGIGADIYWDADKTKYDGKSGTLTGNKHPNKSGNQPVKESEKHTCTDCKKEITDKVQNYSIEKYGKPLCMDCQSKAKKVS